MTDRAPRILRADAAQASEPFAFAPLPRGMDAAVLDVSPDPFVPLFDAPADADAFAPLFEETVEETDRLSGDDDEPASDVLERTLTYEQGVQAGRDEVEPELAHARAEIADLRRSLQAAEIEQAARLGAAADRLGRAFAEAVGAMETDLVTLAVETASAVLDAPLTDKQRAASHRALAHAAETLAGEALTVTLHPVDLLAARESGLADGLDAARPGLRWEADESLAEGDWRVATDDGAVHRVRAAMLGALRDRLGLDAATDA